MNPLLSLYGKVPAALLVILVILWLICVALILLAYFGSTILEMFK